MVNIDYLYNPDAARKPLAENYFIDRKLGFNIIKNGTILPHKDVRVNGRWTWGKGGIVDSEGNFVKSSNVAYGLGTAYTPPPESIQHRSETVIYLGLFYPVWGHCLSDNIRRVWFLKSDFFKSDLKKCPLVYLPWEGTSLENQRSFKRLLEILEINVDRLQPIIQPTQFDQIIVPDGSFSSRTRWDTSPGFTNEYREAMDCLRNFAIKNRTPTSIKKIYFFYGRRRILGEDHLAKYFKSKGYEIIYPEQRENNLDEEINLLINAESFASPLGSCAMNSIFLRDGAELILIPRAFYTFNSQMEIFNQIHPLNITYVDSSLSIFSRGISSSPLLLIVSEQLKKFFGDKSDGYEDEDFKVFLKYVKNSINIGYSFNENAKKYYSPVLEDFMTQLKKHQDLIALYNMPPGWETFKLSSPS